MSGTQNLKQWTSPHVRPARAAQIRLWLYPSVLLQRITRRERRPLLHLPSEGRLVTIMRATRLPPTAFSEPLRRAPGQTHQKRPTSQGSASTRSKLPPLFLRLTPRLG